MTGQDKPERVSEADLERAAKILGPLSASHRALADCGRRRELGETPAVYVCGNRLIVLDEPPPALLKGEPE